MKVLLCLLLAVFIAGCAVFEETYYVDREFGQASQATWDRQVVYANYRYAAKTPEGLSGIESGLLAEGAEDSRFDRPTAADCPHPATAEEPVRR